jgi:hypothetical protein
VPQLLMLALRAALRVPVRPVRLELTLAGT